MIDYYLKFSSKEEALSALKVAGYTMPKEQIYEIDENLTVYQDEDYIISATHQYCVDEVGTIYKGGRWGFNELGEMITIEEPVKLDGFHVNIRVLSGDIAETLRTFVIDNPSSPYRIFG
jgi:autonomous glycyl radical cofactor GrcA